MRGRRRGGRWRAARAGHRSRRRCPGRRGWRRPAGRGVPTRSPRSSARWYRWAGSLTLRPLGEKAATAPLPSAFKNASAREFEGREVEEAVQAVHGQEQRLLGLARQAGHVRVVEDVLRGPHRGPPVSHVAHETSTLVEGGPDGGPGPSLEVPQVDLLHLSAGRGREDAISSASASKLPRRSALSAIRTAFPPRVLPAVSKATTFSTRTRASSNVPAGKRPTATSGSEVLPVHRRVGGIRGRPQVARLHDEGGIWSFTPVFR